MIVGQNACPACMRPWVGFPAPHKLSMVEHTYNHSPKEVEAGDQEFKDYLRFKVRLGLAWAT